MKETIAAALQSTPQDRLQEELRQSEQALSSILRTTSIETHHCSGGVTIQVFNINSPTAAAAIMPLIVQASKKRTHDEISDVIEGRSQEEA